MEGLLVLRRVDTLTQGAFEYLYEDEGDKAYFPKYVDNDRPRDDAITQELMEKTIGFAIADSSGQVYKKFKDVASAETARANAKPSFAYELEVDGETAAPLDDDDEEETVDE